MFVHMKAKFSTPSGVWSTLSAPAGVLVGVMRFYRRSYPSTVGTDLDSR